MLKDRQVSLKLDRAELERLEKLAREVGLNRQSYVRMLLAQAAQRSGAP
jgi:predicted DNA binding CopG/RHH family protein